jgi:hypothetical protein
VTARLVTCGASGVDEKRAEWVPLDPGEEPSEGARLAVVGGANGVTILLVELEAEGFIAEHATPEVSVCHVIEGAGTVFLPGGEEISFERGTRSSSPATFHTVGGAGTIACSWPSRPIRHRDGPREPVRVVLAPDRAGSGLGTAAVPVSGRGGCVRRVRDLCGWCR